MTSSTETGHPSRSASHRWKIQPKEFRAIFDPSAFPKLTYLLYEIKWGSSTKFWRKWCPNTPTQHAEINCLENDFKAIHHRPSVRCSIIWFLSWSPCGLCCRLIIHFLRAHPKVSLQIYIGRLFRLRDERNRQGLRDLVSSGVNIYIMSLPAYDYCWRTFVDHRVREDDIYWPCYFTPWMIFYMLEFQCILQVMMAIWTPARCRRLSPSGSALRSSQKYSRAAKMRSVRLGYPKSKEQEVALSRRFTT
uniref:CMP/dCMP-type deaminase domain-containing protein n=1 Tax=Chrysemys picta bellii TaxID=8478 RepID=A0A8C3HLK6_CHRPI